MPGGNRENKDKTLANLRTTQSSKKASVTQGEKLPKRTMSEISSSSETSFDTGQLSDDLQTIKKQLCDLPTKMDIDSLHNSLVGKKELETLVAQIVKNLLVAFEDRIQKDLKDRMSELKENYEKKLQAIELENETLNKELKSLKEADSKLKKDVNTNKGYVKEAIKAANFNEQYSRKNNIKILNLRTKENQNLRTDLVDLVRTDLGTQLDPRDVIAIHRIPAVNRPDKPVIVRFASSEVKQLIMRQKKNLKNNVRFIEDITKKNLDFMKSLRECKDLESVWYYNTNVYGRTRTGLQIKFELFDDVQQGIRDR